MKGISKNIKDGLSRILSRYPEVEWVKLFGSRSRGDADQFSDIDLAVYAPEISPSEWAALSDEIEEKNGHPFIVRFGPMAVRITVITNTH